MIRNLKILSLALIAAFALSVVAASAASAVTNDISVGIGDGNVHALQIPTNPGVLTYGTRTVACGEETLIGSMSTTSSTLTLTPTYGKCHSILAGVTLDATVTMNECAYIIHVGNTTAVADQYSGTLDLECTAGKSIEIHVYKEGTPTTFEGHINATNMLCRYTIAPQAGLTHLTAEEITTISPRDITVSLNITAIAVTRTLGTIANCGAAAGNATLKGGLTATGKTTPGVATGLEIIET